LISGFCRDVDEIYGLLGNYTASCGNYLPTFRDNVSVPSSWAKIPECPETSVNNYHTMPCNYPEDHRFHTQKFDAESFNLKKLSELEVRKQYQIKISKQV
jgi:hypothetical protein